jgi:hypothetical protein
LRVKKWSISAPPFFSERPEVGYISGSSVKIFNALNINGGDGIFLGLEI